MTGVRSMSDEAVTGTPESVLPATAGSLLREAREASGLHIAALAVSMKVPVRKLEALEADRLGELPDAVFARALASSMCRALKIDPAPVLALLPSSSSPLVSQVERGINAPFHSPGDVPAPGVVSQLSKPTMLVVLALLVGAAVILLLPSGFLKSPGRTINQVESVPETVVPIPPAASVPAEPSTVLPPSDAPATPAPAGAPAAALSAPGAPSSANAVPPPVNAAGAPAAAAAAPVVPGVQASTGVVTFSASGASWVEVVDSTGAVTLRRTLQSGESAGASGALPLTVVVGRADMTRVQVRGKDYNLASVARDNVARFEVK